MYAIGVKCTDNSCLVLSSLVHISGSLHRSFSVAGPCLWNCLPVALRDRDISLVQFVLLVKPVQMSDEKNASNTSYFYQNYLGESCPDWNT